MKETTCIGCEYCHVIEVPASLVNDINPNTCRYNPPVIAVCEIITNMDMGLTSMVPETFFPDAIGRCGKYKKATF